MKKKGRGLSLWVIFLQIYGFVIPSAYNFKIKHFKPREIKHHIYSLNGYERV